MVQYRRNRLAGGTYFFTVTLRDRCSSVLTSHVDELRRAYAYAQGQKPFETVAIVVLPDHLHAIWALPKGDSDYSERWRLIKGRFSRAMRVAGIADRQGPKNEIGLWQRRFWEHTIRDDADLRRHVEYLHFNPVKHGLVSKVADWPFSSYHRFVERGALPCDWGGSNVPTDGGNWGE